MATGVQVPGDFSQLPLEDQDKVALAMMKAKRAQAFQAANGMPQQTQVLSGYAVKHSPLEMLARLVGNGMAENTANSAEREAIDIQKQGRQGAADEYRGVLQQAQGMPGTAPTPEVQGNNPSAFMPPQPGTPAVAPDVAGAMMRARTNRYPGVQALGAHMATLEEDKQKAIREALFKNATQPGIQAYAQSGNLGDLKAKDKIIDSQGGIVAVNEGTNGVTPLTPNRNVPGTMSIGGVTVPSNKDTFTGKETSAAGSAVIQPKAEIEGVKFGLDLDKNHLEKSFPAAQTAAQSLATIKEANDLLTQGATTGFAAPLKIQLNKAVVALGGTPDPNDQRGEQLARTLGQQVVQQAKALGPNPSDGDRIALERLLGSSDNSAETISRIMALSTSINQKIIADHNGFVYGAEENLRRSDKTANLQRYRVGTPLTEEDDVNLTKGAKYRSLPGTSSPNGAVTPTRRESFGRGGR